MNHVQTQASPPCPPVITPLNPPAATPRPPWGFWGTTGLGVTLVSVNILTQSLITAGCLFLQLARQHAKSPPKLMELAMDGDLVAIGIILGFPVTILFTIWFIKLRQGPAPADYLGLRWPSWRPLLLWGLGWAAVLIASERLTLLLDRPSVPEVMLDIYRSAQFKPLLWLGIVLFGPVAEEVIFRGFLFRGWQQSCLGSWGTILLTSLLWASIHLQYDAYGIATIFAYDIFLGWVRLHTGSMLLCIGLHSALNLIATIQVELDLATA
ncbi:MAG TPA: type II CAAX endopeptidase family protein [Verrucomicrobiota bacterium]|nr:type II CAAX endopeptidase family protein [Verrucomicrobiota bacterium]HNT14984.1 type II CAAX endopeptidase family protein [Verrucomicrobiota bacterium]